MFLDNKIYVWGGFAPETQGPPTAPQFGPWQPVEGAVYDLLTDVWLAAGNFGTGIGAPEGRYDHTFVVLSNGKLGVLGGERIDRVGPGGPFWPHAAYSGGYFDPATDTWFIPPALLPLNGFGFPLASSSIFPKNNLGGVAIGDSILAWGGTDKALAEHFASGRVLDTNSGAVTTSAGIGSGMFLPLKRAYNGFVWTGEVYLVFGGQDEGPPPTQWFMRSDGGAYDPIRDSWLARPLLNAGTTLEPRQQFASIWTGSHFLVWGGFGPQFSSYSTGGLYHDLSDQWLPIPPLPGSPTTGTGGHYLHTASIWTGDRWLKWGGGYRNETSQYILVGGGTDFLPPRVAPTIRNLEAVPAAGKPMGDRGASAGFPLTAKFNESFKHRIVCYGTPEAAVITYPDKPWWMTVGWGGPGPLVAHGTGQGNGGTGGAPPGTGAPFHPWFSATGGTADGQWIRGTPGPRDTGLHSFTVHAHNGIFPDTSTKTVWIEVEGPSVIASMPTTYATGAGVAIPNPQATGGGLPLPPVTHEVVALAGVSYLYFPTISAIPAGSQGVTATWTQTVAWNGVGTPAVPPLNQGLPAWLAWDGFSLSGIPGVGDEYQTINVSLVASNVHGSDSQQFVIHVLPYRPIHAAMLDVNGDSVVDVLDVQAIVNVILSIPVFDMSSTPPVPLSATVPHPVNPAPSVALRGDLTLDGSVDTVDVQALVNGILGR